MTLDTIGKAKSIPESAVVIVGGTSGIGLASALRFVAEGCQRLVLVGRSQERGEAAKQTVKDADNSVQVEFVSADAGDPAQAQQAIDTAVSLLGGVDVLINSVAASYVPRLLFKTEMEDISGILTGQAVPPMLMSRAVMPYMREQKSGSIINIASDAAKVPTPGESVIGAGMAAIVIFSRTLAIEAKRDGIRVNALTPSLVNGTGLNERIMADPFSAKLFGNAEKLASLGVATPEDLAGLIVYLGGPDSARLTGQAISLNGGISAG